MPNDDSYAQLLPEDRICIDTLRFLAVDAVQKANSGHPGLPMGMAATVYRLFTKYLKFNPKNPNWVNRDRFVLSAGHGSAMLYSILHLTGYDVSLEDIKSFRQLDSKTPGHPERGHTPGVEATTGPLGQGMANAVGMAIAERYAASYFNRPGFSIIDYNIYVLVGDGCLQEGVAAESCSLAGHLGLDNLIAIYDDNRITIDGGTDLSFTEDVAKRFESYGWFVQEVEGDGNNLEAFDRAMEKAQSERERPSLIKVGSIIGFGSPNRQNTSVAHGAPLGEEEIGLAKRKLGWEFEQSFFIPELAKKVYRRCISKGEKEEADWQDRLGRYRESHNPLFRELDDARNGRLPENWDRSLPQFRAGDRIATRVASGKALQGIMPNLPLTMGGSADLTPSNNTKIPNTTPFQKDTPTGRYLHFGVREHAMGAVLNGIALSGLVRAYGATFLCFSDYMLPAIRVAALSGYGSIFVFTHDSIGLGEDGPTHQPVEQLSYLRAMPGLTLFRPADATETVQVWKYMLENRDRPVAIALTRQGVPVLDRSKYGPADQVAKGGYLLVEEKGADTLLIATGSEVELALAAADRLGEEGIGVQVASLPSVELFERQPQAYRNSVIPPHIKARVVIEAGLRSGWDRYLGERGEFVGMDRFGASAPAGRLFEKFGITVEAVVAAAKKSLS